MAFFYPLAFWLFNTSDSILIFIVVGEFHLQLLVKVTADIIVITVMFIVVYFVKLNIFNINADGFFIFAVEKFTFQPYFAYKLKYFLNETLKIWFTLCSTYNFIASPFNVDILHARIQQRQRFEAYFNVKVFVSNICDECWNNSVIKSTLWGS